MDVVDSLLEDYRKACPRLEILVIGMTGVGKSTLVNNLLGKKVATEGDTVHSATSAVAPYELEINGKSVVIYDTPGLGDTREDCDEVYLEKIKEVIPKVHVIIYCIKMNETRMHQETIQMFQKYNKIGVDWGKTVFALTFADGLTPPTRLTKVPGFTMSAYFEERLQEWRKEITQFLREKLHVDQEILSKLKINPTTDFPKAVLPNGKPWFTPFWLDFIDRLSPGATVNFMDIHNGNVTHNYTNAEEIPVMAASVSIPPSLSLSSPLSDNNSSIESSNSPSSQLYKQPGKEFEFRALDTENTTSRRDSYARATPHGTTKAANTFAQETVVLSPEDHWILEDIIQKKFIKDAKDKILGDLKKLGQQVVAKLLKMFP